MGVVGCYLSIPEPMNQRLLQLVQKKGHERRQPLILYALQEYLEKNDL